MDLEDGVWMPVGFIFRYVIVLIIVTTIAVVVVVLHTSSEIHLDDFRLIVLCIL